MGKLYTIILALLWAKFAVNGETNTPNLRMPVFKLAPDRSNPVLVGRNIKLEWTFKFPSANNLSRIMLFSYELRTKAKTTIASKDIKTQIFRYNPHLGESRRRYVCEISYDEHGFGKASIFIRNVQFNHTFDYGIILQMAISHLPAVENSVSVNVVDMVRSGNSIKTISSWFGQRLCLSCEVVHHSKTKPLFKWYKKSLTGSRVKSLLVQNNSRNFVIKKVNSTDFGEYTCVAKTRMITVKQKFKVKELGYAGPPRKVEYTYYPTSKSYVLRWEQPSTEYGERVKYVLEEWKTEKRLWVKRCNITALLITITKVTSAKKYRVCSENEIGYTEKSCSKTIELPKSITVKSDEKGKSCRFWPSLYLTLAMAFLSGVVSRYE